MEGIRILWVDDEVDLLRPQMMFLEQKGYEVDTVTNGHDALEEIQEQDFDIVFLDESMPGMTGLETLEEIKKQHPSLPVVMITKNEAEDIMEEAIGSQITDYLIKPVNPHQILLSVKKIIDNKRLVQEKTSTAYQQEFRQILMDINSGLNEEGWYQIYRRIIDWELKIDASRSEDMQEILDMQKKEANTEFSKYILKHYDKWVMSEGEEGPTLSNQLMRKKIFPHIDDERSTVILLLDNCRFDQWKVIEPILSEWYKVENEDYFYSILPTSTQYSRNAIFSGLMPLDIQNRFNDLWLNDNDKGGKNNSEDVFFDDLIQRTFRKPIKHDYHKITTTEKAKQLNDNILNVLQNDVTVIVYNFIDMLSHARTEMEVLKELAGDETAYRSLTKSWFEHSPLYTALQRLAERNVQLFVTTDHGTIRVGSPSKVVGDRETTTNLRYKMGKNLQYDPKDVLEIRDPKKMKLPSPNLSSTYIFALEDTYFLYPNNYNYYNNYFRDTFQHGGVSLEEMICPIIRLSSR